MNLTMKTVDVNWDIAEENNIFFTEMIIWRLKSYGKIL